MDEIIVFQQPGSGSLKVKGIREFGHDLIISKVFELAGSLPDFIDDPKEYFPEDFSCDLVLSFLQQPDLLDYLASLCSQKQIPLVASGRKCINAITPFTCCSLGRRPGLGQYGAQFGIPEYDVEIDSAAETISKIDVRRGASCGATWQVIHRIIGLTPALALECIAREVQYLCSADPSNFDPITGKSPVHVAGYIHAKALEQALKRLMADG